MTLAPTSNQIDSEPVTSGVFSFPASFAQRRLWFLNQLAPGDVSYNVAGAVEIEGVLDIDALEKSVQEIVRRHESLRTHFESNGGEPEQVIDPEATVVLERVDLRPVVEDERLLKANQLMREESQKPFDLRRGPLVRATLIQLAEQQHRLLVTMHHIISDGWSVGILVAELAELYNAFSQGKPSLLPELPIQYADYSAWQQEQLRGESLKSLVDYWKRQLDGSLAGLEIVTDRPHRQNQGTRGAEHKLRIQADLVRRLRRVGQEQGATLYMILLAGFQALLFRYSGQEEILVGSPIAGRTRKETQGLIGFFVNTLVMRSSFTNEISFRELLRNVKETTLDAYAHQDLPFEKLVEELSPERNLGRSPFFQAMFVFQNAPMPELQLGSAILRLIDIESETAKFEITLTLFDSQDELQGTIEYSTELFDPDTIARFADQFTFLLDSLLTEPDRSVSSVPLVSDRDMIRLRLGWAGPTASDKADTNVPGLVQEHASDEAKVAIVSKGPAFTYAELNRRAGELSGRLQTLGIERGTRVGICVSDGVEAIVALLGVLKTAAVAVPLDADDPVARMEYIVKDAGVSWVVSDAKCNERVLQAGVQVLLVNGTNDQLHHTVSKQNGIDGHSVALLLYQSDPLGKPKGVGAPHNALLPRPFAGGAAILEADRIGLRVRLGSRESETLELLRFLALGATIIDLAGENTPRKLATVLRDQAVTVLLPRAAELERLATEFGWALKTVRMIVLGEDRGMALEHLRHNPNSELLDRTFQAYGSNETGGWWALHPMDDKDEGLTAHLAAGVTLQLLDIHGKPVPEHIVGELYIGGNNIARGDHSQSGDKSSAVSADYSRNVSNASRCRSGEFGWRRADGSLQLSGRHDGRGWISGIRVEAEEIEIVLKDYAGIRDAAVLVGDDMVRAFVVVSEGEKIDSVAVQTWLGKRFPPAMIPQRIDRTEKVPRLTDGTVDRRAVKALADRLDESNAAAAAYAPPRNEIEQKLAAIWQKTLGLERVGIHDDFFRIGGHSLLATQVVARISDDLGATVPLRQLFETPTIAQLGSIVGSSSDSGETLAPIRRVARVPVGQHNLAK